MIEVDEVDGMVDVSARESADRNIERAAEDLGLNDEQKVQLTTPFREVKAAVPVRMDDGSTATFLAAGKGKVLSIVGETITLKFTGEDTGGAFCLFEDLTPPHGGPPPHVHHWEDETFFVLDGKFEFNVGGRAIQAGPGDSVFCPRDVPHFFRNIGDSAARTLTIVSPADFEGFFERADAILRRDGEVTPEQLAELGSEFGLEFLGP